MKYAVVYLLTGAAKHYHEYIVKEVVREFGTDDLTKKIPAHLTIKSPFINENSDVVEGLLEGICRRSSKSRFRLEGFGRFRRDVIFLKVKPSEEMRKITSEVHEALRKIDGMTFSEYERGPLQYHATIAYCKSPDISDSIWSYLRGKNRDFDVEFDNLALLKRVEDNWQIYKAFKIE